MYVYTTGVLHLIRNTLAFLQAHVATMDMAATSWKLSDFLTSHITSILIAPEHLTATCPMPGVTIKIGPPLNRVPTPSTSKIITALGKVGMSVDMQKCNYKLNYKNTMTFA